MPPFTTQARIVGLMSLNDSELELQILQSVNQWETWTTMHYMHFQICGLWFENNVNNLFSKQAEVS